ncbi:MltA domain-containing protein [Zoogloea sp.]|uniref:murein transglycosylase A n=1 Tax=Zoogloea sp. TaxID=49181 RepID=UPI0025FE8CE7|nr:MltA domain-containing protein [Zoogloea sp.]MCK6392548.1 MltA domain-containing protein [Zoogloea sp.]
MFPAFSRLSVLFPVFLLAACAGSPRPVSEPARAPVSTPAPVPSAPTFPPPAGAPATGGAPAPQALARPLQAADWSDLPSWAADPVEEAWPAFLVSCRAVSRQAVWRPVCDAARALGENPGGTAARRFFEARLSPWRVLNADGTREGLVTGYYEPLIKGSRSRSKAYPWPVHGVPDDLLTIDMGDVFPDLKGQRVRGRLVGNRVVPYYTRAEVARQAERFAGKTLLYAEDAVELFFLQVQGSGRVQLPDGSVLRLAYGDANGHPYQSIGRWLVDKGEMKLEQASMEGIKNWARANPGRLQEMLNANPSYIFFREVAQSGGGPVGALGQPLTEGRSLAVDPRSIPLGAPVFLATTQPNSPQPLRRLMLAQDTGSAIKGGVRGDFFWGFGADAGALAGRMRQKGEMWVLWPRDQVPR